MLGGVGLLNYVTPVPQQQPSRCLPVRGGDTMEVVSRPLGKSEIRDLPFSKQVQVGWTILPYYSNNARQSDSTF